MPRLNQSVTSRSSEYTALVLDTYWTEDVKEKHTMETVTVKIYLSCTQAVDNNSTRVQDEYNTYERNLQGRSRVNIFSENNRKVK